MRVPEEPVCSDLFRQNPVFTSLYLKSPFHVHRLRKAIMACKKKTVSNVYILCPFAVYYLRYAVRSFFTLSRISPPDGKRAGQKLQRKIAAAVQNVKPLYFLSRSFEIR